MRKNAKIITWSKIMRKRVLYQKILVSNRLFKVEAGHIVMYCIYTYNIFKKVGSYVVHSFTEP